MVDGVLNIDKPSGITSHDAVQHVRRALGERRVGHAGTLDPFATGILVIAAGKATRLLEYMHMLPKTYNATFILGATSDTDDVAGVIASTDATKQPTESEVKAALDTFIGNIEQIPPQYAAIKVQGKKMYELAREGKRIEANPRSITVHSIGLTQYAYPEVDVVITCGTGTYIRAIGRDLGEALGTGAYTNALRRTHIGSFAEEQALTLDDLTENTYQQHLLPPESLVAHLPRIELTEAEQKDFEQGKILTNVIPQSSSATKITQSSQAMTKEKKSLPLAIFSESNSLIGVGKQTAEGALQPDKVLSV